MFLAYNNLIPSTEFDGNFETQKKEYVNQVSKEAPKFLAYIEIYNSSFKLREAFIGGGVNIESPESPAALCSGSLINSQYVLTLVNISIVDSMYIIFIILHLWLILGLDIVFVENNQM